MKKRVLLFVILLLIILAPVALYCALQKDVSFFLTSLIFALPVVLLLFIVKPNALRIALAGVLTIGSILEFVLVWDFGNFLQAGNILAFLGTNTGEAESFVYNNLILIPFIFVILLTLTGAIILFHKTQIKFGQSLLCLAGSLFIVIGFITYKQRVFYHGVLTNRYYIENRILTRPPYNFFYQIYNVGTILHQRHDIEKAASFSFQSRKMDSLGVKESYIMAIGESMRYDNVSMNKEYKRITTPKLDSLENCLLYGNYYSGACLTMFSVPQIITRATPQEYDLNYKEKSIFLPFKENGFKTFVIVTGNLLADSGSRYLTNGVDSLIATKEDKEIPILVEELSSAYDKTFFILQFLGCHSYYYNYEKDYDIYHPNINSDKGIKSDSLYINAYDNTILYADHILFETIRSINHPDIVSGLIFVSDHGENVTATGGGHGGDCAPKKQEYHVPLIYWYSNKYKDVYPEKVIQAHQHHDAAVCSDNVFYSLCDMANISLASEFQKNDYSIFSESFEEHPRFVLLPDGVNVMQVQ